jgi:hypothetical protein
MYPTGYPRNSQPAMQPSAFQPWESGRTAPQPTPEWGLTNKAYVKGWAEAYPTGYPRNSQSVASQAPSRDGATHHLPLSRAQRFAQEVQRQANLCGAIDSHLKSAGRNFQSVETIAGAISGYGNEAEIRAACESLNRRGIVIKGTDSRTGKVEYIGTSRTLWPKQR